MPTSFTPDQEIQFLTLVIVLVPCLIVGVFVNCYYLRTLAGALRECSEQNRAMKPGHVWLNLIPFFSVVWIFVTVNRVLMIMALTAT